MNTHSVKYNYFAFSFTAILTKEQEKKKRELRFSLATADSMSFNSFDNIGEIIESEYGPNTIQLHRTKNIALTEKVLGPHFRDELIQDLQHEDCLFSILTDETTDQSSKKLLAFSVRYYSPRLQAIKETHLDLKEMIRATSALLMKATGM